MGKIEWMIRSHRDLTQNQTKCDIHISCSPKLSDALKDLGKRRDRSLRNSSSAKFATAFQTAFPFVYAFAPSAGSFT